MASPAFYEIPLRAVPERFGIAMPDGTQLIMTVTWRNRGGAGWVLDLDTSSGTRLVSGVPMVPGTNLLAQHKHLGIPGLLMVLSDGADPASEATYTNLGDNSRLYYVLQAPV